MIIYVNHKWFQVDYLIEQVFFKLWHGYQLDDEF
jgi:hypothetical protein